ncbi:conjugal transfer protein TraD [Chryseobacterium sp. OSA05B]|uniref:conjugal transfer protein TraD n=1 Tax=Chryseobacterium sp. OSA05B TaxID=2862650 RepID=UPI001CC0F702|nr:conjugal transfer protein TraD [Chryseobacterium sp. OSA05B]
MEILIITCLLIIIVLLVQDKVAVNTRPDKTHISSKNNTEFPAIIGKPKTKVRQHKQEVSSKCQIHEPKINPDNLDIEYDIHESIRIQLAHKEQDPILSTKPDYNEEEEEWKKYRISGKDNGFAQGVTFEELSSVETMLQREHLEPSQKETAAAIVQKINGTELFDLLDSSIESASRQIAELLDGSLSSKNNSNSSFLQNNNLDGFDIGDFT